MKNFIGTKRVKAKEMTNIQFNILFGKTKDVEEIDGYLVEYLDGGKPNHPDYDNYISWTPKEVFEKSYRNIEELSFSLTLEALKLGEYVTYNKWNKPSVASTLISHPSVNGEYLFMSDFSVRGHGPEQKTIFKKDVNGNVSPWIPDPKELLEDNWSIIKN